jgi:myosin protein heavy chain
MAPGSSWQQSSVRNNVFSQQSPSVTGADRPGPPPQANGHVRNNSSSKIMGAPGQLARADSHRRSQSLRSSGATGTFAPTFIKADVSQGGLARVERIEGENDFSGKKYVWVKNSDCVFIQGWITEGDSGEFSLIQCEDGTQQEVHTQALDRVNPAKFDKASDMAELTHLNEPSVVHNLHSRYKADLIYTYSGLFLVAINPYCPLPIYSKDYVNMYRGRSREDTKPHIFAIADEAFRNLVDEGQNQSILVTGESGAGKTENTKKVIQYLAAVATNESPAAKSGGKIFSNLSQQILRANPILEAFGNAQTVRNNNSSRFGKFIRIQFTKTGQIAGAYIDWYLLEKSRVVKVNSNERNYHIFYQLLRGANEQMKRELRLTKLEAEDFEYTKHGNETISGVSDQDEWNTLIEAFHVMGMSEDEQHSIFRAVASVLHLGNIKVKKQSMRADQAALDATALSHAQIACKLLGIPFEPFVEALLHPRVKAGREWVKKVQTPEQVSLALDALAKGIYERTFGDLVDRINQRLNRSSSSADDTHFIGVLDIAGFEIFEENSFEQLCINYTNEKLQQFFNHHMFVLEQEEYAREQIEWQFIDFGRDLQPTIDLIEITNPIGIFSCLDEDSVMPKATDNSFTEKLHQLWDNKTPKYRKSLLHQGFTLTHYAAEVEYSTEGWLDKNKDPLNDNVTRLLAVSQDANMAHLFADCADLGDEAAITKSRVKKGLFRTVAQRHKEQLSTLMTQLHSTHPHFVRCILPNHKKKPKLFNANLVLDQLRCNGVLEGIRIARTGFPNRLSFAEFRSRYEVLCKNMPRGYIDGQTAAKIILEKLDLDTAVYRVGLTKVFFRAGVLAVLEEQRDNLIREIMSRFQSLARGFTERRAINKRLYRAEAARIIQHNFQVYLKMQANPWWKLFVRMRPLLGATHQATELKKREDEIKKLEAKMLQEAENKQKVEEDRRRTEQEMEKIQQVLESERVLALDKEEIFKRLQDREAELSDKLNGALEDQDVLEDQIDELMLAKQDAQSEVEKLRTQLEQAGKIMLSLEAEKNNLMHSLTSLQDDLTALETTKQHNTEAEDALQKEIRTLTSQLAMKERKIQDLETQVVKVDQDLEVKFASASRDLQMSKKQIAQLSGDNQRMTQQLADLTLSYSTYEDTLRMRDSELTILRNEKSTFESRRSTLETEVRMLGVKHESVMKRLHEVQGELEATKSFKTQLEREATDAKRILENKLNEDAESFQSRKMLEQQIHDLKAELFQVQSELGRERQSRDDVQMLERHKLDALKKEYESLNKSKITIEKELYVQQDVLRRTSEARNTAEKERRERTEELRNLRQRYLELQEIKLHADDEAEHSITRQAMERQQTLQRDLEAREQQLGQSEEDRDKLANEVRNLKQLIGDSDMYKVHHDQHKERLERELATIRSRLTASENDNRALLTKVQQKNLDLARSNSKASDSQKTRLDHLQAEKAKQDEQNKRIARELEDAKLTISTLEKQKEKLTQGVEDLRHELDQERKSAREAEKGSSTSSLQIAEINRKLETERQLRTQAQSNSRAIQASLDGANDEIKECRNQLALLAKVFNPEVARSNGTLDVAKVDMTKTIDLARKVLDAESSARMTTERLVRAEAQLDALRNHHQDDMMDLENRHTNSKRALLEELDNNQLNTRMASPTPHRNNFDNLKSLNSFATPPPAMHRHNTNASDSARSDRTVDTHIFNNRMDVAAELELTQNQLQIAEMRNRHLQTQLDRSPTKTMQDDSPSARRVQKLERENFRLHDMLDDSAKKVSALEQSLQSGDLSLKEVRTKSHEELFDLIKSQEDSRRSLLQAHNATVNELSDAKVTFDGLKQAKAALEVETRDARSELEELKYEREQEEASRQQLLQEFSDLQMKLDDETSKLLDSQSSLNLYKSRADEYYNKLEQAEIAVLRASRAEQFAKTQGREAEDQFVSIAAERQQMEGLVEDLQRQVQGYEERVEDIAADLEAATQAKKRLQHELEDYRNQRAIDVEDKETTMEQTRKKYQSELSTLGGELELEREAANAVRSDNSRLRDELEELRAKWDDELLNSSTWAKEKARLEMTLENLSQSRDEASSAHNEAQNKVVSLLSQVRELRTSLEDAVAERDNLTSEKKGLETRLNETKGRLDELARSESPSTRNAARTDKELLQLRADLAQKEDIAVAAVDKMRRSEALVQEIQQAIASEREKNVDMHKERAALDKTVKDLQLRLVDLETKGYSSASQDVRFLHGRVQEVSLASQLSL